MIRGVAAGGLSIALCLVAAPVLITVPALAGTNRASAAASTVSATGESAGSSSGLPIPAGSCTPATPSSPDTTNVDFTQAQSGIPWAQSTLSYPSVWKLTEGSGETVALIDSGVDANSLLDGRVEVGREFVTSGSAAGDCVGHGTMAAGLIAASSQAGGLGGMAPQATILSEKVTNTESIPNVNSVIQAIGAAVSAHVQVINMSLGITMDLPEGVSASSTPICQAVDTAMAANIVVVAAAGNIQTNSKGQVTAAGPFYPASCPGVLSVGAVNQDGSLASFSSVKSAVDVTAPGVNMKSTFPGTNGDSFAVGQGTSFSAPLVAGLAALVRARYPQLSQAQVIQRIEQTADGSEGPGTGNGLINPVQALTAVLPAESNSRSTSVVINRPATNGTQKTITLALTGGAVAMVVIVLAAAVVIPAGRRRRWRPGGLS